jgi:hypothetical protein
MLKNVRTRSDAATRRTNAERREVVGAHRHGENPDGSLAAGQLEALLTIVVIDREVLEEVAPVTDLDEVRAGNITSSWLEVEWNVVQLDQ